MTGWAARPTPGRRDGRVKLGAARMPEVRSEGGSSPDNVATGRRQRPGRGKQGRKAQGNRTSG